MLRQLAFTPTAQNSIVILDSLKCVFHLDLVQSLWRKYNFQFTRLMLWQLKQVYQSISKTGYHPTKLKISPFQVAQ